MKKHVLFFLTCLSITFSYGQSFEGLWTGSLKVQGIELPLVLDLAYDGQWKGTLQSPKQSPDKIPMTSVQANADSITIEVKAIGLKYAGKLSPDKAFIDGTFSQGGLKAPLRLDKQSKDFVIMTTISSSQAIKPPYSYDTINVHFTNKIDQVSLGGTITKPKNSGKHPAVVLVSGSGPQDRNSRIFGHEPFKVIADYLTKQGIIVLRYDDRGVGQSTGDFKRATTGDFAKDALAGVQYLKTRSYVNPNKIGIIGHSEGGLIAFILAGQQANDLNFIVSLAGPSIKMDSLMILQSKAVAKSMGQELDSKQINQVKRNYELAKSNLTSEKAFEAIMSNMKVVPGTQNAAFADEIGVLVTPWYRYFLKIDPVPFLKKIKIPVFAAYGGKDIQVPALENEASLKANIASNLKNQINVYPQLNHLMQEAKTGGIQEYSEISEAIHLPILADIAKWIKRL